MKTLVLLLAAMLLGAQGQQTGTGSGADGAVKLDKNAIRMQIAEMKVKSFEMQTQIEVLEKQLKDAEEVEERALAAKVTGKAAAGTSAKVRCSGSTRDGKRCTRPADPGSRYCWQHKVAHR